MYIIYHSIVIVYIYIDLSDYYRHLILNCMVF